MYGWLRPPHRHGGSADVCPRFKCLGIFGNLPIDPTVPRSIVPGMEPSQPPPPPTGGPHFPVATVVPFAAFNNRYRGRSCHVVGRGPTEFDYASLADVADPVFFINDAVCLEGHARGETFFFAHDPQTLPWLDGRLRSTAVLPIDGKLFERDPNLTLGHRGGVAFYHWCEAGRRELLEMDRDAVAAARRLYVHSGTIHSVLHFIWFCGFARVSLVGCDCLSRRAPLRPGLRAPDGYDRRLRNASGSVAVAYAEIGRIQRLLTDVLGLEATYLGTPRPG